MNTSQTVTAGYPARQSLSDVAAPEPIRQFPAAMQELEQAIDVLTSVATEIARRMEPLMPGGNVDNSQPARAGSAPAPLRSPTTSHAHILKDKVERVTQLLSNINAGVEV